MNLQEAHPAFYQSKRQASEAAGKQEEEMGEVEKGLDEGLQTGLWP